MNLDQFDIQQLRIKHILYKSKVRSALYGGQADDTFFSATMGPVAEWIYNTGLRKYQTSPEMKDLEILHREINDYVHNLLALYRSGKLQEAREGLAGLESYSEKFLHKLNQLEGAP